MGGSETGGENDDSWATVMYRGRGLFANRRTEGVSEEEKIIEIDIAVDVEIGCWLEVFIVGGSAEDIGEEEKITEADDFVAVYIR